MRNHHDFHIIAAQFARHSNRRDFEHTFHLRDSRFDFKSRDVFAAHADAVFHAPGEMQMARDVDVTRVTGVQPRAAKSGPGGNGVTIVAEHEGARFIRAHQNFTGFTGGQRFVVLVGNAHFKAIDGTTTGGQAGAVVRQVYAHVALGGAVARAQHHAMARLKLRKIVV